MQLMGRGGWAGHVKSVVSHSDCCDRLPLQVQPTHHNGVQVGGHESRLKPCVAGKWSGQVRSGKTGDVQPCIISILPHATSNPDTHRRAQCT